MQATTFQIVRYSSTCQVIIGIQVTLSDGTNSISLLDSGGAYTVKKLLAAGVTQLPDTI